MSPIIAKDLGVSTVIPSRVHTDVKSDHKQQLRDGLLLRPPISPLVLADIRCLYIPCAFVTHFGKCIDEKTPLLRSMDAVTVSGLRLLKAIGIGTDAKAGVLGGTCDVGHGGTWWDMVGHGGTWWHAVGWSGFVDFFPLQSSSGTVLRVVCCGSKKLKT